MNMFNNTNITHKYYFIILRIIFLSTSEYAIKIKSTKIVFS
jgi:hypothetical protein